LFRLGYVARARCTMILDPLTAFVFTLIGFWSAHI
jgi:hypothetical protein